MIDYVAYALRVLLVLVRFVQRPYKQALCARTGSQPTRFWHATACLNYTPLDKHLGIA